MASLVADLLAQAGGSWQLTVLAALFAGVLLVVLGVAALLRPQDAIERRLALPQHTRRSQMRIALRNAGEDLLPPGLSRVIAPANPSERMQLRLQLARAGFRSEQAVMNYYLLRALLGLLLPLPLLIGSITMSFASDNAASHLPLLDLSGSNSLVLGVSLLALGFYGPPLWLRRRIASRQQAIRDGFPHALDMLQVAVEAGLGFDSALARVAGELRNAHPALAEEFVVVGFELRAGKSRDQVLQDLATRTGVDAISVFTKVIVQSIAFGTSIAGALQVYAREMRHKRMMAAEEKANQLPVKMSVVMVLFLLPTIFLVALSPVIIRLIRMFSSNLFNMS